MKKLMKAYGQLVKLYGKDFAKESMQNILYHEVKNGRMTLAESKRIFASLGK